MSDGRTRPIASVRIGDEIYGTVRRGHYRYYQKTRVLAHWSVIKPAYRIRLEDGTEIIAGADHRFMTERGWKFVTGTMQSSAIQRPYLTTNNELLGTGSFADAILQDERYEQGYLCGMIRGDANLGTYLDKRRNDCRLHRFRLALCDPEGLRRTHEYLWTRAVATRKFVFQKGTARTREMCAIRTSRQADVARIRELIAWPTLANRTWCAGFLAGIFDAEGSLSQTVLRISNTDPEIIDCICQCLSLFDFRYVVELASEERKKPIRVVRLTGGLREQLRFFHTVDPAIRRKLNVEGQAIKSDARLRVVSIEPVGKAMRLYDISTGTEDFIANGVVSHNCYARPSHAYLGLSSGLDFESRLFYKENAAGRLSEELCKPGYVCKPIAMGTNTDPYQPLEKELRVTRSILEVLEQCHHPVTLVTKSTLILRDLDLLASLARQQLVSVAISVTTLSADLKRTLEPRAASPRARLAVIEQLSAANIPVSVLVAPVVPALNDQELEAILAAVARAGARHAGYVVLRLPYDVKDLFREWLAEHQPLRAEHVMSLVHNLRGGRDNDPDFGSRMRGTGPFAALLAKRFQLACRRYGLNSGPRVELDTTKFQPPRPSSPQLSLWS